MQQGLIALQNFDARFRMQSIGSGRFTAGKPLYSNISKDPVEEPPIVKIQPGNTLSEIVRDFLKNNGIEPTLTEIYQGVEKVAGVNGISDPDKIFVGQSVDLSSLLGEDAKVAKIEPTKINRPRNSGSALPVEGRISSKFGLREHPIDHELRMHKGVDIAAPEGTPIHATGDGRVVYSGWKGGYGQVVEIDHGQGYRSLYAHTSENLVSVGDVISKGDEIAQVGTTGRVTGPHVHYELQVRGKPIDPLGASGLAPLQRLAPSLSPLLAKAQ